MERKLIFVYNANTDPISVMVDYAHKILKPSTYRCELCTLTHHSFGERSAWKNFRNRSNAEMEFMYIRGFESQFNVQFEYPVILEVKGGEFFQIIGKAELQKLNSIDSLIEELEEILEKEDELL